MNTRNIPALVMLTAGLVAGIVMFRMHYSLYTMSWVILLVFAVFYVLGCLIRLMLDKFGMQQEKKKEAEQEGEAALETGQQEERQQTEDGAVIEKQ